VYVSVAVGGSIAKRLIRRKLSAPVLARVSHQSPERGMNFEDDLCQVWRWSYNLIFCAREKNGGDVAAQFIGNRHKEKGLLEAGYRAIGKS
jgi:hypothetical protein